MKVGLVLEGGAMRAMFSAGVLDVFMDNHIPIDGIVGVSAGALFGVNLPSGQRGRVLRYNLKLLHDKRYMGLHSLLTTGNIVNKDFTFYEVPYTIDPFDQAAFARSNIAFYATLTNVASGKAEYIRIQDVFAQMEVFRATAAMPLVSKMVELEGQYYLDGGIADSIPLEKCRQLGYNKIIVVLTRPLDYRKTPVNTWLFNAFYKAYPALIRAIGERHLRYNQTVEEIIRLEQQEEIFVIRPSQTLPIRRIEKDLAKVQAMYDLGVNDCRRILPQLQVYLNA